MGKSKGFTLFVWILILIWNISLIGGGGKHNLIQCLLLVLLCMGEFLLPFSLRSVNLQFSSQSATELALITETTMYIKLFV